MTGTTDISSQEEVDEFLLAAYLSRGLPSELRHEIELYLLGNGDARDLLGMANDALAVTEQPGFESEPLRQKVKNDHPDADEKTISWSAVNSASSYAVVVYDAEDQSIVNMATTKNTALTDVQALAYTFRESHRGELSIWVMALDSDGNVIRSSTSVQLVSNRYGP